MEKMLNYDLHCPLYSNCCQTVFFWSLASDCEFLAKIVHNMKKADVFTQKWNIHFKLSSIVGHELSFVE